MSVESDAATLPAGADADLASERSILRGGAVTFVSILLGQGLGFLIKPVLTRYLDEQDYGALRLGLFIVEFVLILGLLGLHWGVARYVALCRGRQDQAALLRAVGSGLKLATLGGLAAGAALFLLAPALARGDPFLLLVLRSLAVAVPFSVLLAVILAVYTGYEQLALPGFADNVLQDGLVLLGLTAVVLLGSDLQAIAFVYAAAPVILCLGVLAYSWRKGLRFLGQALSHSPLVERDMVRFSLPMIYNEALRRNRAWLNPILVGYIGAAVQTGMYDVAYTLATLTGILNTSLRAVFQSVLTRLYGKQEREAMGALYARTTRWTFCASIPIFMVLLIFPGPLLAGIFGPQYRQAAPALQILTLAYVIQCIPGASGSVMLAYGRSAAMGGALALSVLVNIGLIVALVPGYGVAGTAVAFLFSMLSMQAALSWLLYRDHRVHPFTRTYLLYAVLSVVLLGVMGLAAVRLLPDHWLSALLYLLAAFAVEAALLLRTSFADERDWALLRALLVRPVLARPKRAEKAGRQRL